MHKAHTPPPIMPAARRKRRKKPGTSPGSLVYTGHAEAGEVALQLVQFTESALHVSSATDAAAVLGRLDASRVNWIAVHGLHDTAVIETLGSHFSIDPLVLEDILNTGHMPKLEVHDRYLFLTLKMLSFSEERTAVEQEHFSMLLCDGCLITFQEKRSAVFDVIREILGSGTGRLRKRGADYLFYRLLDTIVDHYYLVLDRIEDSLEAIEEELLCGDATSVSEKILAGKKNMLAMRRAVMPLRESMRLFSQRDVQLITESTYGFFDDICDHLLHLEQTIEHSRELFTNMMELQVAVNANRLNNVMKTLTIFASIFMPLTFLAGIYGMNFDFMPELGWRWGYPLTLGLMAAVAVGMLLYMRRRKWL